MQMIQPSKVSKRWVSIPPFLSLSKIAPVFLSLYIGVSMYVLLNFNPSTINDAPFGGKLFKSNYNSSTSNVINISADLPDNDELESKLQVSQNNRNSIPNILVFTYTMNLISANESVLVSDPERRALKKNVQHSIDLHPGSTVRFLSNDDCETAILRVFPDAMGQRLLQYFRDESEGMFKGDLCRGIALYETGGIYLDVDLGVRMNLLQILSRDTSFATVRVHKDSKHPNAFFQAFIAVKPRHPILRRYIDLFQKYYAGKLPQYHGKPLGVVLLRSAYDELLHEQPDLSSTIELWQEVQYKLSLQHTVLKHVPPPLWGKRRACKFIVVSSANPELVVPLYSRIAGSRMCPVTEPTSSHANSSH